MTLPNTFSKKRVLSAACVLARRRGIDRVKKQDIADYLGCATGTINTHWGSIAILREAVRILSREDVRLVTGRRRIK